jgi:hypothetical protein
VAVVSRLTTRDATLLMPMGIGAGLIASLLNRGWRRSRIPKVRAGGKMIEVPGFGSPGGGRR